MTGLSIGNFHACECFNDPLVVVLFSAGFSCHMLQTQTCERFNAPQLFSERISCHTVAISLLFSFSRVIGSLGMKNCLGFEDCASKMIL